MRLKTAWFSSLAVHWLPTSPMIPALTSSAQGNRTGMDITHTLKLICISLVSFLSQKCWGLPCSLLSEIQLLWNTANKGQAALTKGKVMAPGLVTVPSPPLSPVQNVWHPATVQVTLRWSCWELSITDKQPAFLKGKEKGKREGGRGRQKEEEKETKEGKIKVRIIQTPL